jgi:anaerobic ribonucleoside-triphosphate reductase activating protein
MQIGINKIHYPVTTLGYGRRIVIWMQGCSIHCTGCVSKDTWDFDPERETEVAEIALALASWMKMADGLTISGGEPFDQPKGLLELLRRIRPMITGDILLYSGYRRSILDAKNPEILAFVDVLIDGPFEPNAGQSKVLRGSDNQTISLLTATAVSRYSADINNLQWQDHRRMDVVVDEDTLWMAGIPELGSMPRFREELARRGLNCTTSDQFQPLVRA